MKLCLLALLWLLSFVSEACAENNDAKEDGGNYQVQCWQQGVKIIDEKNLSNYKNFIPLSSSQIGTNGVVSISFSKINGKNKITVLDLNRATCMIKDEKNEK
jgi:hypothetical protein